MILAIVAAFVVGSIMTGTMASAQKGGAGDNLIADALNSITAAIMGIPDPTVNVNPTPITINAPQGDKGDKGDQGIQGEQGIPGPKGPTGTFTAYQVYKHGETGTDGNGNTILDVECLPGDIATGGGAGALGGEIIAERPIPQYSDPSQPSEFPTTGWRAIFKGSNPGDIHVVCLDVPPLRLPPIIVIP